MPEITLEQILKARDNRVLMQKNLLAAYKCPLISFTMNIAGPIKTSLLIKRAFMEGIRLLDESLPTNLIHHRSLSFEDTGFEAMYSVNMDADSLKDICTRIEEVSPLGRLFDMDVISLSGKKLERNTPRCCLICGGPVHVCSSRRTHSVPELQAATNTLIKDYFELCDRKKLGALASQSLLDEVNTTPKPGLVDQRNSGSHTDMDYDTFIKSIGAISPYFLECVEIGQNNKNDLPENVFSLLREAGKKAEIKMFAASDGVNTYKGIIYSLGIILGALGMLWTAEVPIPPVEKILNLASKMVKGSLKSDFVSIGSSTAGGRLFLEFGILGIRGEVASGFPSVTSVGLPAYENALALGKKSNDAGVTALLHLIACVEDTNIYNRGGKEASDFVKAYARDLLKSSPCPQKNTSRGYGRYIHFQKSIPRRLCRPACCYIFSL